VIILKMALVMFAITVLIIMVVVMVGFLTKLLPYV
jgi:hypothetical protein